MSRKRKTQTTGSEKSQKAAKTALYWLVLNLGMLLLAAGVYFFKAPNNFATGGVSGISIIISKYVTPLVPWLSQTIIMNAINVLLLIVGFIFLGKGCTFKTVYCCLVYNLEMFLMGLIIPTESLPLTATATLPEGQKFLEFMLAMLLTGAGSAIIFNCGASSGGTDIIALILKKYTKINVGVSLLIVDLIVASASIFTIGDVAISLYSYLGLFARTFLLDGIIESFGKTKYITIITQKPEEISDYILNVIQHGVTMYDAEGGYTHESKKVLITVCKRGEALRLKTKVKTFDPEAFVIITDANEILGKGFVTGF